MIRGRSRFHRYEGGDPLAPPVDLAEALDAIGDGVMAGSSPVSYTHLTLPTNREV